MRVRAVSHVALGEENAHTAAASANAIATVARGRRGARSRALAFSQRALLAVKYEWRLPGFHNWDLTTDICINTGINAGIWIAACMERNNCGQRFLFQPQRALLAATDR